MPFLWALYVEITDQTPVFILPISTSEIAVCIPLTFNNVTALKLDVIHFIWMQMTE